MPIFETLLDIDFYKLTMAQFAWKLHRDVPVTFSFTNRTKVIRLPATVSMPTLCEELAFVQTLRFTDVEIAWLRESEYTKGLFEEGFLTFLANLRLPEVRVENLGVTYRIETEGAWPEVTFWETIVLGIVNELHFRSITDRDEAWKEGARRLGEKLRFLEPYPNLRFAEFGTRRRYSRAWQDYVVGVMARRHRLGLFPQFLGTSNVALAMKYGLRPIGTMAHETFMAYAAIYGETDKALLASHNRVLRDWEELYGPNLLIALTDTFGTDFFTRDMTEVQAESWAGFRLDSGDPFEDGEKILAFLEGHGIDPKTKVIVPSDGLDVRLMVALDERFAKRTVVNHGCGTHLSNDVGVETLSLVMKLTKAVGRPTVKLSNNPAKAMGPADEVARYKRVFGHEDGNYLTCKS